jgi:transcriptional regulator with XRE-family HTH domain
MDAPARPADDAGEETRLAYWRRRRGVTRPWLAAATGISEATLWRLESGRITNPPVLYLTNCALALEVTLDDVLERAHRQWHAFDSRKPYPPERAGCGGDDPAT